MTIDPQLVRYYAERYWSGFKETFGDLSTLSPESPDYAFINALQSNVWQFSGAKNYSQLQTLSKALIDQDGKLQTFSAFQKIAASINADHVGPWLKAEYELAVAGGQMSAKWQQVIADGVPLLEFDAVLDNRTTQTCRDLNGVVKPVNDPFWNIYYPPNHWRCRSHVRDRYSGAPTPDHDITYPDIPPMFQVNLAKERLVFPKGHPYFDGCPEQVLNNAKKLLHGPRQ